MQTEEYQKMRESEDTYWWFISRRKLALSLLAKFGPKQGKLLDLGCGTGAFLSQAPDSFHAFGLDFSDHAVNFCAERNLKDIVQADAQNLPFSDSEFNAVVTLDTLEHVPNDAQAISEICRVLRPGGVAIINVPAYKWLWGPHDVALMHFRRYTQVQLVQLLQNAGFKILKSSYSVFFMFPVVMAIRALDKFRKGPARVKLPHVPRVLNRFLVWLQDVESSWILSGSIPWGSSVVVVAKKLD